MTWEDSEIPLAPVLRAAEMEKADAADYSAESRALQLTTARPGGDVLALGTDMDEVVFCEHPQLLPLLCIVDKLKADASEHLIIRGATRHSVLVGQGANLRCDRGIIDTCPIGQDAIRMRELCTCFAISHKNTVEKQFGMAEMHADINRIYASLRAGFSSKKDDEDEYEEEYEEQEDGEGEEEGEAEGEGDVEMGPEAEEAAEVPGENENEEFEQETASWDVAAYPIGVGPNHAGYPQLRMLQLWIASSQAKRTLRLRSPQLVGANLPEEFAELDDVVRLIRGKSLTVGQLMGLLIDDRAILAKDPSKILKVLKSHLSFGV
jgi:hypothetical protein